MEIRQLTVFVAVAEELNFTRASARLRLAQSAVSATIHALETELNTLLFDRSTRRVELSTAGVAFLPKARAAIDAVADARDAVDQLKGEISGTLSVGFMTSVTIFDLPQLLGRFSALHPQVRIALRASERGSQGLTDMLSAGMLDVAFVANVDAGDRDLRLANLGSSPLLLAVPADHPLASQSTVRLRQLVDLPFIDFPSGYGNRSIIDRAFARAGLKRNVRHEISDIAEAAALVRNRLGVAFLPQFLVQNMADIHTLSVEGEDLRLEVAVAMSGTRRRSRAGQALWELATDLAPERG